MGDRLYYTRRTYNIPARYGQKVYLRGSEKDGIIVSSHGPLLVILFDEDEPEAKMIHFNEVIFAMEA